MEKKYVKIVLAVLVFFFAPISSFGASLAVIPASGTYETGQKFTVRIIATSATPFNAVSLSLLFPPSIFTLDSVTKTNSLLTFWVKEPVISKSSGTITLEGVSPGGIKEVTGTIITATLHGNSVGSGVVSFQSGQILANDGEGTNIIREMIGSKYSIIEAKPKPQTTPELIVTPTPIISTPTSTISVIETSQPSPTLNAPEIMLGEKYGAQAIVGTSEYPKIQVLITLLSTKGIKIFIMGTADKDGSFTLLVPRSLKHGDYRVTARVIGEGGLNSKDSNAIIITIGNLFSDIGWETIFALFLLLLLILYLFVRIFLHLRNDRQKHLAIKKETEEAEAVLHGSLDILKQDMENNEKMGAIDTKKFSEMNNTIDDAEQKIKKEIDDIDTIE